MGPTALAPIPDAVTAGRGTRSDSPPSPTRLYRQVLDGGQRLLGDQQQRHPRRFLLRVLRLQQGGHQGGRALPEGGPRGGPEGLRRDRGPRHAVGVLVPAPRRAPPPARPAPSCSPSSRRVLPGVAPPCLSNWKPRENGVPACRLCGLSPGGSAAAAWSSGGPWPSALPSAVWEAGTSFF